MSNTDRVSAGFILVVTAIFGSQMGNLTPFGVVFPRAVLITLAVLSIALLVKSWARPEKSKDAKLGAQKGVILAAGLVVAWAFLISRVGFYVSSVLVFCLMMMLVDSDARRPRTLAVSAAIAAVEIGLFYLVFAKLLTVPLPTGALF